MSINIGGNNNQINPNQSQNQQDTSKILFTKTQFTNSIMSALAKGGANTQQTQQFSQQASSIFDQHDVNGDSKWSQQEAENGGSVALANLYQIVNDALKGVSTVKKAERTEADKVNEIKNMSAAEQADAVGQVLEQFISDGGKITGFDGKDIITIVDKNGVEHKESLKGMGLSDEGIEALKPQIQIEQQGNEIDEIANDAELINNPENAKTIARAGKAGYDNTNILNLLKNGLNISVVNGKYQISDAQGNSRGTISLLQDGQYSFDKEARFTNLESTINKYESQGYEVSSPTPNKENHTIEIKIEKNGKTETITIDPKTGFEVSKEEH